MVKSLGRSGDPRRDISSVWVQEAHGGVRTTNQQTQRHRHVTDGRLGQEMEGVIAGSSMPDMTDFDHACTHAYEEFIGTLRMLWVTRRASASSAEALRAEAATEELLEILRDAVEKDRAADPHVVEQLLSLGASLHVRERRQGDDGDDDDDSGEDTRKNDNADLSESSDDEPEDEPESSSSYWCPPRSERLTAEDTSPK